VLLRLAALAGVALLVGCGSSKKSAQPTSDLPPGCSVDEVDGIVTTFLTRPALAPAGQFQVYADYPSDKRSFVTHERSKALTHLRGRLALGEKSRLIQLRVARQDFNHVRITYELTRHAPDFARRGIHGRLVQGGGTVDCAHRLIAAWVSKGP
jgi:hypothetical protein